MKRIQRNQVALLGFGTVGLGVYKVLQMQKEEMQHKIGTEIKIKKILVRNLGKKQPGENRRCLCADRQLAGDRKR
mgnify:CR=1 FL=1